MKRELRGVNWLKLIWEKSKVQIYHFDKYKTNKRVISENCPPPQKKKNITKQWRHQYFQMGGGRK